MKEYNRIIHVNEEYDAEAGRTTIIVSFDPWRVEPASAMGFFHMPSGYNCGHSHDCCGCWRWDAPVLEECEEIGWVRWSQTGHQNI